MRRLKSGKWKCPVCGERFEPTTLNIYRHTYHETVLYRCERCKAIIKPKWVSFHRHGDSLASFTIINLLKLPKAIRQKKIWLWEEGVKAVPEDMSLDVMASNALEAAEQRRKEIAKDAWKPSGGENLIQLDATRKVRLLKGGQYGDAVIVPIIVKGKKKTWLINQRSPVVRELAEAIKQKIYKVRIDRTGQGKATRYDVKLLK